MRYLIIAISAFCTFVHVASAQDGETGLAVLKIGIGGRTVGMGDAGVVSSIGAPSMHYNPAIIAHEMRPDITVMHNSWIEDVNTEYLGAYSRMSGYSLGFHVAYTGIGGIEVRQVPGPAQDEAEAQYISTGVTVAVPLGEQLEAGATVKMLFEKIYTEDAFGYAFDFGARYRPFESPELQDFSLGLSLSNIGEMGELHTRKTSLPKLLRYGAAYEMRIESATNTLQLELGAATNLVSSTTHATVGVEAGYDGIAFLRAGYQGGYEIKGFSAGAGVRFDVLSFDYAYTPFKNSFGSANTISLSIAL